MSKATQQQKFQFFAECYWFDKWFKGEGIYYFESKLGTKMNETYFILCWKGAINNSVYKALAWLFSW